MDYLKRKIYKSAKISLYTKTFSQKLLDILGYFMQSQFGTICFESVANFTASGNIGASTEFFTHLCICLYRIQHRFTHVQYLYIHRDFALIFCTAKMTFKV